MIQHKKFILQYLFILYPLRKINTVWGYEEQKKKHAWRFLTKNIYIFNKLYILFSIYQSSSKNAQNY